MIVVVNIVIALMVINAVKDYGRSLFTHECRIFGGGKTMKPKFCKNCGIDLDSHTHTMKNVCQVELNK